MLEKSAEIVFGPGIDGPLDVDQERVGVHLKKLEDDSSDYARQHLSASILYGRRSVKLRMFSAALALLGLTLASSSTQGTNLTDAAFVATLMSLKGTVGWFLSIGAIYISIFSDNFQYQTRCLQHHNAHKDFLALEVSIAAIRLRSIFRRADVEHVNNTFVRALSEMPDLSPIFSAHGRSST
jgi:hypothetical protein